MPDWALWIIAGVAGFVVLKSARGWFQGLRDGAGALLSSVSTKNDSDAMLTLEQAEAIAAELGINEPGQRFRLFMLTEPQDRRKRISLFLEMEKAKT